MAVINLKVCTGNRQVVLVEKEKAFFVAFILYAFQEISKKKKYIYLLFKETKIYLFSCTKHMFYCSFPAQNHTRTVRNLAAAHYLPGMSPLDIVICP